MSANDDIREINIKLADKINDEALRDPNSPYVGKFVGIASGNVVVVADTMDESFDRLVEIEPDPSKCFLIEAGVEDDEVCEIGGMI